MSGILNLPNPANLPTGIARPRYDRAELRAGILHIGIGNFHRAHRAASLTITEGGYCIDPATRARSLCQGAEVPGATSVCATGISASWEGHRFEACRSPYP